VMLGVYWLAAQPRKKPAAAPGLPEGEALVDARSC